MTRQCRLDFGDDGSPPCASKSLEVQPNSLQQLKAEIAELADVIKSDLKLTHTTDINVIYRKLRQLSAV